MKFMIHLNMLFYSYKPVLDRDIKFLKQNLDYCLANDQHKLCRISAANALILSISISYPKCC